MTRQPEGEPPSLGHVQAEEALLEPRLPHGGMLPSPPALVANRSFVWLVVAHGTAQLGTFGFFLAIAAKATYELGARPFELAVMFSCYAAAFLLLTAPLGMITDRWSPRWMMAAGNLALVGAAAVAMAAHSMTILYVAAVTDGVSTAAAIPARGALTALLVGRDELVRANGMVNTASMLAVIVAPGVTGLIIRGVGHDAAYWYVIAAVTAGVALLQLVPDRRPRPIDGERSSFAADLVEGFRVVRREPELRVLTALVCTAWFTVTVLITLEPLFVKDVLGRGVDRLGFLWSAYGVGAFLGAAALTRSQRGSGREVWLIGGSLLLGGLGYLTYVGTSLYGVAVAGNATLGVGFGRFLSLTHALIQRVAAEHLRGRITGVVGMLQETSGLVSSLGIVALGGLVVVQPFLVVAAVVFTLAGIHGLRAGRRFAEDRRAVIDR